MPLTEISFISTFILKLSATEGQIWRLGWIRGPQLRRISGLERESTRKGEIHAWGSAAISVANSGRALELQFLL